MANEEKFLKPVHPGEVLDMEFLKPLKLSQNKLARDIGVPPRRLSLLYTRMYWERRY